MATKHGFIIDRAGAGKDAPEAAWNELTEAVEEPEQDDAASKTNAKDAKKRPRAKKAAWVDEDDGNEKVNLVERRRTRKFRKKLGERSVSTSEYAERIRDFYVSNVAAKTGGTGDWARLPTEEKSSDESAHGSDSDSSEDGELAETVAKLFQKSGRVRSAKERKSVQALVARRANVLRAGTISMARLQNVNSEAPNKSITHNVEFHPSGRLVLTAGLDRTLRIFQVDGRHNAKIQGVKLADLQISSAHFTNGGDAVVLSGSQRHIYKFDLNSGAVVRHRGFGGHWKSSELGKRANDARGRFVTTGDGTLLAFLGDSDRVCIVSDRAMQLVGTLHVPGQVVSAAFDPVDNHRLYTTTDTGTVQLWDARKMQCIDQHRDEGTVHGTAVAASSTHYAVGADTGIVNVYEKSSMGGARQGALEKIRTEKPKKSISNLTTTVSEAVFNHDGKILAVTSRLVKDAIRLVHVPSMTVFSNWPAQSTHLRRVQSVAFSPGGGYLAVGNDKGDAHLYRIGAYPAN